MPRRRRKFKPLEKPSEAPPEKPVKRSKMDRLLDGYEIINIEPKDKVDIVKAKRISDGKLVYAKVFMEIEDVAIDEYIEMLLLDRADTLVQEIVDFKDADCKFNYEADVYTKIINRHQLKHSVNALEIRELDFDGYDDKSDVQGVAVYTELIKSFPKIESAFILKKYKAIITECSGITLSDYITQNKDDKDFRIDIADITLQVMLGIREIQKYGLQHNDLHAGNVLVAKHDQPLVDGEFIYGERLIVKFFDWDLAYAPELGENHGIGIMCLDYGVCGSMNIKFDLYAILVNIFYELARVGDSDYYFYGFFKRAIKERETEVFPARMCNLELIGCIPYPLEGPESVMRVEEALKDDYFMEYRTSFMLSLLDIDLETEEDF